MVQDQKNYWENRYNNNETGWDIGYVSTPLKVYFDQLTDKSNKILIPGGGNSYEAEYLHQQGFKEVYVVDIAPKPLQNIQERVPDFPKDKLIQADFFELPQISFFDLIIEQTFFCAIHPSLRRKYAEKCHQLLNKNGKISGLLFDTPLFTEHPPYGGNKEAYLSHFEDLYHFKHFETSYNSIPPRQGKELFIILKKINK